MTNKNKKEIEEINRRVYGNKSLAEFKKDQQKERVCLMWINIKKLIKIF